MAKIPQAAPVKRLLMQPAVRNFNRSVKPPGTTSYGGMMLMGASLGGMAYLSYKSINMNKNREAYTQRGETFMSPLVQKRVSQTLGYFGFGLGFTALIAFSVRNSAAAMNLHWGIGLAGMIGFGMGTRM